MKLHGLSLLDDISDRDRSRGLICSNEIPDQKVSPFETGSMLIDHNADVEGPVSAATVVAP